MSAAVLLMNEHRIIERIIPVLNKGARKMAAGAAVDPVFIDRITDFFRSYSDRCHHGKEEDILFRVLAEKSLSPRHRKDMNELAEEHVYLRKQIAQLALQKEAFLHGNKAGVAGAVGVLKGLADFYPNHIDKEDNHFFTPAMDYLSRAEQEEMMRQFAEFDRKLFHEKYSMLIEEMEKA